jgi:hypothetical protein
MPSYIAILKTTTRTSPRLLLPEAYRNSSVQSVAVRERRAHRGYLTDTLVEDREQAYRLSVTMHMPPKVWRPLKRSSYRWRYDVSGLPSDLLASEAGVLRYSVMPHILRDLNCSLDVELLGRRHPAHHTLECAPFRGSDGFVWVAPDNLFDFRNRAYRDVRKESLAASTIAGGALAITNVLLMNLDIFDAAADVQFAEGSVRQI